MVSLFEFLESECEAKKRDSHDVCEQARKQISAIETCSKEQDCSKEARDQAIEKLGLTCAKQEQIIQSNCDKVKQKFLFVGLAKKMPTLSDCQDIYGYHTSYEACLKEFLAGDLHSCEKDFLSEEILSNNL